MSKDKQPKSATGKAKQSPAIRIDQALQENVKVACEDLLMSTTQLVNQALREYLEHHGYRQTKRTTEPGA
jgi:hypothetical protein